MLAKSYGDEIAAAKRMLAGMKTNAEKLEKQGLDVGVIAEFETLIENVMRLDDEQNESKARGEEKKTALREKMDKVRGK